MGAPEHRLAWWWDGRRGGAVLGGLVRLALDDGGSAAFECGLLPGGARTVLLADHTVRAAAGGRMELRSPGLWVELVVEEPGEHLSVGMEAFGVAVDDPDDAWHGGPDHLFRGNRLPVGLDLEAERASEPIVIGGQEGSTAIPCRVFGEVLVADEVHDVDGWGWWTNGVVPQGRVMGRLDDGTWWPTGIPAEATGEDPVAKDVGPVGRTPVLATNGVQVDRRLVQFTTDGRPGVGWAED
ncbi:MAG: hypothetical protein VX488_02990 [Actinomycetota bacterium]|nr:hypothetical protein [Actinomycetota bacterium]